MTTFNDRISTEYLKHPRVNPDFIFLDGPDQFKVKGHINNISTNNLDMMPMSCDILKYEKFFDSWNNYSYRWQICKCKIFEK